MGLIYEPKGRAKEYSPLALNVYKGCSHDCKYCYVKKMPFKNATGDNNNPLPRNEYLNKLKRELKNTNGKVKYPVLLSFMSDPYQPIEEHLKLARQSIELLKFYGYPVQILTKGGKRAFNDLSLLSEDDYLAVTLTCMDDDLSKEWEPGAALPQERIELLKEAKERGINTWVSFEPVLDPEETYQLYEASKKYVDLFRVGVMNYFPTPKPINWGRFGMTMLKMLQKDNNNYYFKHDLRKHLPNYDTIAKDTEFEGIKNPKK